MKLYAPKLGMWWSGTQWDFVNEKNAFVFTNAAQIAAMRYCWSNVEMVCVGGFEKEVPAGLSKTALMLLEKAKRADDKTCAYDGARQAQAAWRLFQAGLVTRKHEGRWSGDKYLPGGYITLVEF